MCAKAFTCIPSVSSIIKENSLLLRINDTHYLFAGNLESRAQKSYILAIAARDHSCHVIHILLSRDTHKRHAVFSSA